MTKPKPKSKPKSKSKPKTEEPTRRQVRASSANVKILRDIMARLRGYTLEEVAEIVRRHKAGLSSKRDRLRSE